MVDWKLSITFSVLFRLEEIKEYLYCVYGLEYVSINSLKSRSIFLTQNSLFQ